MSAFPVTFVLPVLDGKGKFVNMGRCHVMRLQPVVGMSIVVNKYRTRVSSVAYNADDDEIIVTLTPDTTLFDANKMGYGCPCLDNILQNWKAAGWTQWTALSTWVEPS